MHITRIDLKRFRKFGELSLDFSPGLNIIRGKNEQGKSTLVAALIAGLFYDPKKNNKDIRAHKSWGEDRLYDISLEFDASNARYVLTKDFENKELLLKDESGKEYTTFNDVKKVVASVTGLSTPTLFESTACVKQDKIAALSSGKKELETVLQDVVTSGADSVSAVDILKRLQKVVKELKKGLDRPTKFPGKLKELIDTLKEKESEYDRLFHELADISAKKKQIQILKEAKESLTKELVVKSKLYKENSDLQNVQSEYGSVKKELTRVQILLDSAEKIQKDIALLKERKILFSGFDFKKIRDDESVLRELEVKEKVIKNEESKERVIHKPKRSLYIISAGAFLLGFLGLFIHPAFYVFFAVGVAGVVYTYVTSKPTQEAREVFDLDESIAGKKKEILSRYSCGDIEEFLSKKDKYESLTKDIDTNEAKLQGVLSGATLTDLEKKKTDVATKLALLDASKKQIGVQKKLSPEEVAKLEYEVQSLERELKEVEVNLMRAEARVDASGDEEIRMLKLSESITELKEDLVHEETRLAVYEETFKGIFEAKNRVSKSAKMVLEEDMREYLPKITAGKYSNVSVDDDLVFSVQNEAGEMIRPEEQLSRGTIDQFYLVARFSLIKLMSENKKPPVLLDDPLVTFDDERKKQAMELIKKFSKDYQLFLFTYADAYDAWADNLIEL